MKVILTVPGAVAAEKIIESVQRHGGAIIGLLELGEPGEFVIVGVSEIEVALGPEDKP